MKRINIVAQDNGLGLTRDIRVLQRALAATGNAVWITAARTGKSSRRREKWRAAWRRLVLRLSGAPQGRFDANVMIQQVRPVSLDLARTNLLIPNPEWFQPMDAAMLAQITAVLCRTHSIDAIFTALGSRTHYIGFTSEDRLDAAVPRTRAFFHLAGGSTNKGTETLLAAWRKHPHWPTLTVVQSRKNCPACPPAENIVHRTDYLSDEELRALQNSHRFHVCPSETEGYGHYLVEAMGVGAVVLATDAPPMNEMVTPDRGIRIAWDRSGTQRLATTYFVSEAGIVAAVEKALALTDAEVLALGDAARAWFVDNDRAFAGRVSAAIDLLA